MWQLEIGLTGRSQPPAEGTLSFGHVRGGPVELLRWIETQLGLAAPEAPLSQRVTQYSQAVEKEKAGSCYEASFKSDRWKTSEDLLHRRDELLISGWDGAAHDGAPAIVNDLARVQRALAALSAGSAERLKLVLQTLDNGQVLPAHDCILAEPPKAWPSLWRRVLERLRVLELEAPAPGASESSSLVRAQLQSLSGATEPFQLDSSLRWVECQSRVTACDLVAHLLAKQGLPLNDVTILCEDESTALLLDGCLANAGLPTMGAISRNPFHPALQVVPLALRLLWEPVDPQVLLDFLSLPLGPVPKRAARKLAWALAEQPGYRSDAWNQAFAELCSGEHDPEHELRDRLTEWFELERTPWGRSLPIRNVADCCRRVSAWAARYSKVLEAGGEPEKAAAGRALMRLAEYSSSVGELALTQADSLSEPQLTRLLEAAQERAVRTVPHSALAGGPRWIPRLCDLSEPCRSLIWLGLGTSEPPQSPWTRYELAALKSLGIDVDDGSRQLRSLRRAERRAFCSVSGSLLAVQLATDEEKRVHPIWLQIGESLRKAGISSAPSIPELIEHPGQLLLPWRFDADRFRRIPPPSPILHWDVDPAYLRDRESSSATELSDRLACPNKWVLQNLGALRNSAIASLPNSRRLKGTFCHDVLRRVFADLEELPDEAEASSLVTLAFDEALPRNAAPLAQPAALLERSRLRSELLASARVLVKALAEGGYRIAAMESDVTGLLGGRSLRSRLDCLAVSGEGQELVLDFKYSSPKTYRQLLREGRAVQLATYAAARQSERGKAFPAVGYLILQTGTLLVPEGGALDGTAPAEVVRQSPPIREVWTRFAAALDRSEAWLRGEIPVPSRPMLGSSDWPEGVDLVLDGPTSKGVMPAPEDQYVCKYCDYPALCGLRRLF